MVSSFKYRSVAVILAGLFTVFSVGIPVVLASCPMMKASVRASCCAIQPAKDLPVLKTQREYPCCKTIIAADRNKTEFPQTQNDAVTQLENHLITAILYDSNIFETTTFSKLILNDTHSPPLIEDIPIFTSSLLI
jgi:hypothetical protein